MSDATCLTCPWWHRNQPPDSPSWGWCSSEVEPTVLNDHTLGESVWPVTGDDDSCDLHPDRVLPKGEK
jgi:hypothetical protein